MTDAKKIEADDPVARVEALAAKAAERARQNRERFPEMTKVIDMFKRAFGADQVRVIYVREGDQEMGTRLVDPPERTMFIRDMAFSTPESPEPEVRPRKRRKS